MIGSALPACPRIDRPEVRVSIGPGGTVTVSCAHCTETFEGTEGPAQRWATHHRGHHRHGTIEGAR